MAAALALQRAGADVRLLGGGDRPDPDGERPVVLWPHATRRLAAMDVLAAVRARSVVVQQTALRSWRGRSLWASEAAAQYDVPALFLRRGALHEVLTEALAPGTLLGGGIADDDTAGLAQGADEAYGALTIERSGGEPVKAQLLVDARPPGPQQPGTAPAAPLVRGALSFSHHRLPGGMVCAYWGDGQQLGLFAAGGRIF